VTGTLLSHSPQRFDMLWSGEDRRAAPKSWCAGRWPAVTVTGMKRAGLTTTPEPVPVR
jgi:hypothetical protein